MTQSNSNSLRGYFDDVVNQKHLDLFPKYVSEKFTGHGSPYVGVGITFDESSNVKLLIQSVTLGSPADGKLKVGDEILRLVDGECTWKTYPELRNSGLWSQGVMGTSFTLLVQRGDEEKEIQLVRGLVQGFEYPYQMFEAEIRATLEEWPDVNVRLVNVIEAGDFVAYLAEIQGYNARFGRSAVWAEFGLVRIQDGKITERWISDDPVSLFRQLGYSILEPGMVQA